MTTNKSRILLAALVVILPGAFDSGCAWFFARPANEGSVVSPEGVKVVLVRQECALSADPLATNQIGEIAVVLRVQNPTAGPLTIHQETVRLLVPDFPAVTGWVPEPGALSVANGDSETFEVRFKSPDELCCMDMDLHLDVGKTVSFDADGKSPVSLPPLMFGPSCDS